MCVCVCVHVCVCVCVKCLLGNVESRPLPPPHPVHKQHECNANTVTHPILHYASSPEVNTNRQVQPDPKAASNQPRSARNRRAQESTGEHRTAQDRAQESTARESPGEQRRKPSEASAGVPRRARASTAQESAGEPRRAHGAETSTGEARRPQESRATPGQHRTAHTSRLSSPSLSSFSSSLTLSASSSKPRVLRHIRFSLGQSFSIRLSLGPFPDSSLPHRQQEKPGEPRRADKSGEEPRRPGELHRSTDPQESPQERTIPQRSAVRTTDNPFPQRH